MACCTHGRPRLCPGGRARCAGPSAQGPRRHLPPLAARPRSAQRDPQSRPLRARGRGGVGRGGDRRIRRAPAQAGGLHDLRPRRRLARRHLGTARHRLALQPRDLRDRHRRRSRPRAGHRGHPPHARLGLQHPRPAERDAHGAALQRGRHPRLREGRLQAHRRAPQRARAPGRALRRGAHGRRPRRVRQPGARPQPELLQAQLAQLGPARVGRAPRARGRDRR